MRRSKNRQRQSLVWPGFALPGVIWLVVLFVVPFYGVLAVAFGGVDPIFGSPVPRWNPTEWDTTAFGNVIDNLFGGQFAPVFERTILYVAVALALCFLI